MAGHGHAQTGTDMGFHGSLCSSVRTGEHRAIYAKLLLTALFWGATFIAGKHVAQNLGPFTIAFLRFALTVVLLSALVWRQEGGFVRPSRKQVLWIAALGMTGVFAYNVLFFKGLQLIEASRAALIVATCPAFIAAASALFLREKLSLGRAAGIPVSVLGAVVVITEGDLAGIFSSGIGKGELFILGCVLSWAAYSLIGRSVMRQLSPLVTVCYASVVGALALTVPAVVEGLVQNVGRASWVDWASIAYLAVFGTVLGFVWYYEGVKRIGATRAGLFINFVPIFAVILAVFVLKEPITWPQAVGAALVLGGVCLTNRGAGRTQADQRVPLRRYAT